MTPNSARSWHCDAAISKDRKPNRKNCVAISHITDQTLRFFIKYFQFARGQNITHFLTENKHSVLFNCGLQMRWLVEDLAVEKMFRKFFQGALESNFSTTLLSQICQYNPFALTDESHWANLYSTRFSFNECNRSYFKRLWEDMNKRRYFSPHATKQHLFLRLHCD